MIQHSLFTIALGRYPPDARTRAGRRLTRGPRWMPQAVLLLLLLAAVVSLAPESIPPVLAGF